MDSKEACEKVLDLALALVKVGQEVASDGKVSLADFQYLGELIPVVGPAVSAIPDVHVSQLSVEDLEAIVAYVMAKLSIENAKAQAIVTAALEMVGPSIKLVQAIRA